MTRLCHKLQQFSRGEIQQKEKYYVLDLSESQKLELLKSVRYDNTAVSGCQVTSSMSPALYILLLFQLRTASRSLFP